MGFLRKFGALSARFIVVHLIVLPGAISDALLGQL
jgi:hypothetical protein